MDSHCCLTDTAVQIMRTTALQLLETIAAHIPQTCRVVCLMTHRTTIFSNADPITCRHSVKSFQRFSSSSSGILSGNMQLFSTQSRACWYWLYFLSSGTRYLRCCTTGKPSISFREQQPLNPSLGFPLIQEQVLCPKIAHEDGPWRPRRCE